MDFKIPFWLWLFLLTVIIALLWGGSSLYSTKIGTIFRENPFLQVTNRQLSLFLWQNPEFMRINSKQKQGYLPGFQYVDRVTMELASADQYAVAPAEVLFRFHTWNRLLKEESTFAASDFISFRQFLDAVPEWQPAYWPDAPKEYAAFVRTLSMHRDEKPNALGEALPLDVRIAFQGWKNYFIDGEAINRVAPTVADMRQFLEGHPHYARNYWRNIVEDSNPNYLKDISIKSAESIVEPADMAPFLKIAIFNYLQAKKPVSQE